MTGNSSTKPSLQEIWQGPQDTVGLAYMVDFTKAAHSRIGTARESLGAKTTLF